MVHNNFLKGIEKEAWRSNYSDGLIDLFFAFLLLGNGVAAFIDTLWGMGYAGSLSSLVLSIIGIAIVFIGKYRVTIPRIGKITLGPIRLKKIVILTIVIGLAVISTIALWLIPEIFGSSKGNIPVVPIYFFIFIGAIFGSLAYLLDYDRGYVIALICSITWGVNELFIFYTDSRIPGAFIFTIGSIIILIMGLFVFSHFLKDHPLSEYNKSTTNREELV